MRAFAVTKAQCSVFVRFSCAINLPPTAGRLCYGEQATFAQLLSKQQGDQR
jgi:hypothetical protein